MSHIKEFTIYELAGRKDIYSRNLNRDTNIFFGMNGNGKTSLLKILHSAMSGETNILRRVPFTYAEVKIYSMDYKQIYTRILERKEPLSNLEMGNIEIVDPFENEHDENENIKEEKWTTIPKMPNNIEAFHDRYLPTSRLYESPRIRYKPNYLEYNSESVFISEDILDSYFTNSIFDLWTSYSTEILSAVRKAQEDGLASILKAVLHPIQENKKRSNILNPDTAYKRLSSFLERQGSLNIIGKEKDFLIRYQQDGQLRSIASDINMIEIGIEKAMEPRIRLQELINKMLNPKKKIVFSDFGISVNTADNESISLASLSSGEKQLLRIFVEALVSNNNSIIIDEPELSMHIDWQKELIANLRLLNSDAQYILATHSPEIMADVDDKHIFRI